MLTYFNTTRKISPIKLKYNLDNYEEYIKDVQKKIEIARRQFIKAKREKLEVTFSISLSTGNPGPFGRDVCVYIETSISRRVWAPIAFCINHVLS